MKKITIVMLLLMGVVSLNAQDMNPLVAEGKQWNVVLTYVPWPPITRVTDAYKVEGDTVVEETAYKTLFTTQSEYFTNWELCGLLRETEDGQVYHRKYCWNHTFGNETLLYNFSMQPGDSICFGNTYLMLLRKSDTILDSGNIRKKYDFQYKENGYLMDEHEVWIEGIGSELGLLHVGSLSLVGGIYDLLCYYEDDDLVWHNPNFNSCYISTDGLNENKTEIVSVYPNPARELVIIEGTEVDEVQVYNAFGQLVKTFKQINEINVSDLLDGLYVLRITDVGGLSVTNHINIAR